MGTDAYGVAVVKHDYFIRVHNCAYSLRDDKLCRAVRRSFKIFPHLSVRLVIQSGKRIVENEYLRIDRYRPSYGKALFLSARYVFAALGNFGTVPVFHIADKFVRFGNFCRRYYFFVVQAFVAERYVAFDRAGEKHALLRNVTYYRAQCFLFDISYVHAVYKHLTVRNVEKPRHKIYKRRLTAARRTDKGDRLSLFGAETYVVYYLFVGVGIAEGDVFELNRTLLLQRLLRFGVGYGKRSFQHLVYTLC